MRTRYRARFGNGTWLDAVDSNLAILNIEYSDIERQVNQQSVANLDGFDITNTKSVRQTVTITFELHIYDTAKRNAACQAVNKWAAAGGVLRTSDRGDTQGLRVVCEQFATINARDWTAPMTIVFTSVEVPYWESWTEKTKTLKGKYPTSTMALDGNTSSSLVSVKLTSTKGTIKSAKFTTGSTTVELTGLSIAKDEGIQIDYVSYRYMRIWHLNTAGKRKSNGSLMAKLKPTSSDCLLLPCGATSSIGFTTDNNATVVFSAKGRWL